MTLSRYPLIVFSNQSESRIQQWLITLVIACTVLLGQGCSAISAPNSPSRSATLIATFATVTPPSVETCLKWYEDIDAAIDTAGIRDGGPHRLAGYPHLRVDRFAASFSAQATQEPKIVPMLLWYARDLDMAARQHELLNLPPRQQEMLGTADTAAAHSILSNCSQLLVRRDIANSASAPHRQALFADWLVPDHYSQWKRAVGLYILTSIPFYSGVEAWQQSTANEFTRASTGLSQIQNPGGFIRYMPSQPIKEPANIETIFGASLRNILGVPQLSEAGWHELLNRYSPVFEIDHKGGFDQIGTMQLDSSGHVIIDAATPSVYQRIAFTRIDHKTHVQLIYSIWFSERPASNPLDLLAGNIDGVMLRITLDHDGTPLLVDSIHACGCYHLFFPTSRLQPRPSPNPRTEWAFIPQLLPILTAQQRVVVRLASATHYLTDIRFEEQGPPPITPAIRHSSYRLEMDSDLLSLPMPPRGDGRLPIEHKSAFLPRGLIAGTERGERFLFWPMGIASPGAMRQWGTHATAFVGIRHFDDADLIDKRFTIKNNDSLTHSEK